ncbi:hypothetical protein VTN02DRAFT_2859 [Thermoascus thermophilus]
MFRSMGDDQSCCCKPRLFRRTLHEACRAVQTAESGVCRMRVSTCSPSCFARNSLCARLRGDPILACWGISPIGLRAGPDQDVCSTATHHVGRRPNLDGHDAHEVRVVGGHIARGPSASLAMDVSRRDKAIGQATVGNCRKEYTPYLAIEKWHAGWWTASAGRESREVGSRSARGRRRPSTASLDSSRPTLSLPLQFPFSASSLAITDATAFTRCRRGPIWDDPRSS